jgi:2-succinyl-6-hydroxy-2,4-cyclohexadiene-1-carboxylate synthase
VRVVLIHGFLGAPPMWDRVRAELEVEASAIDARWLPGHGRPPAESHGAGFDAEVEAIAAELRGDLLVGYSMGARLALAVALSHPERVRGAILIGVDPGIEDPRAREERIRWEEEEARAIEAEGLLRFLDRWEALPVFASQRNLPSELAASQRSWRLDHEPSAVAQQMLRLGLGRMPSQWERLPSAKVPLRVLAGALDEKFGAIGERIAAAAPESTFVRIPGAGHNPALEAPGRVAEEIARTLGKSASSLAAGLPER